MFSGFNLMLPLFEDDDCYQIGKFHMLHKQAKVRENLSKYIVDGIIDGTNIVSDWFPQVSADIFISHSHINEKQAITLAGWLNYNFGLDCFVDSLIWGNSEDLLSKLKKLDDAEHSVEKVNSAASHVHMILSTSLAKMIDRTEAIFLLNTNNSIGESILSYDTITFSPWIYAEIICSQLIRNRPLADYRKKHLESLYQSSEIINSLEVAYKITLDHLTPLNHSILNFWYERWKATKNRDKYHALDVLYEMMFPSKMNKILRGTPFIY